MRGAADGPSLVREVLWSPAGNPWTELGVRALSDGGLTDAGDAAIADEPATARGQIEAAVADLIAGRYRPIALGGDHSITYPVMCAIGKAAPGLTILHIDAHGDLYDEFEGDRYSHACPFARIMDEGLAARLVQVGIRTLNDHQRTQARRFGVEIVEMRHWDAGARPAISGEVYLSVDLDGLDPAFAPGVAHREPGGLSVRDVVGLIHSVAGRIVAADIVEFNPRQDLGGVTAAVAAKVVKEIAGAMLV
jgi:agmatinase